MRRIGTILFAGIMPFALVDVVLVALFVEDGMWAALMIVVPITIYTVVAGRYGLEWSIRS